MLAARDAGDDGAARAAEGGTAIAATSDASRSEERNVRMGHRLRAASSRSRRIDAASPATPRRDQRAMATTVMRPRSEPAPGRVAPPWPTVKYLSSATLHLPPANAAES